MNKTIAIKTPAGDDGGNQGGQGDQGTGPEVPGADQETLKAIYDDQSRSASDRAAAMTEYAAIIQRAASPAWDPAKGKTAEQKAAYDALLAAVVAGEAYDAEPTAGMTA